MQGVFLLAVAAFAAVCSAQPPHPLTPCTDDASCNEVCNQQIGVCSPPEYHCHCHKKEIRCTNDDDCKTQCGTLPGCCHNRDHCHCGEECGHTHH